MKIFSTIILDSDPLLCSVSDPLKQLISDWGEYESGSITLNTYLLLNYILNLSAGNNIISIFH